MTIATFALLVPWARRRPHIYRIALTLSISALVLCVAFWTMLPVILGSAGVLLGMLGRDVSYSSGHGSRQAQAAVVIGALAVLASLAAYVVTS